MKHRSKVHGALLLLLFVLGCTTLSAPGSLKRIAVSDGWLAMGTFFEADLRVRPDQAELARNSLEWARVEIARLEGVYSRHDPDSAVSALNRELSRNEVVLKGARLDAEHPGYGFVRHMGYGTREHLEALQRIGASPIHRRSFAPVATVCRAFFRDPGALAASAPPGA